MEPNTNPGCFVFPFPTSPKLHAVTFVRQPRSRAPAGPRCQPSGLPLPLTASPPPIRRARCEAPPLTSSQGFPSIARLAHSRSLGIGREGGDLSLMRSRAHRVLELSRGVGVKSREPCAVTTLVRPACAPWQISAQKSTLARPKS
jgi:hypothetical protein